MFNKSIKLFFVLLLIFAFGTIAVAQVQEKTETWTTTGDMALPLPRLVKDRPLVLGFQITSLTPESAQRIYHHIKIECDKRGWKLIANLDATTSDLQRAGIENLINQNVDAIVHFTGQPETWKDLVLKARAKGIGFYDIDTELRPGMFINTTQPNGVVGAKMVYYGVDRLLERGNVLILQTGQSVVYRQRSAAAKGLLETEWPALKMVGYELMKAVGSAQDAFDLTQNYLSRLDNKLNWVCCPWDSAALSAARAIEEAGLTRADCFATGIDGGTQAYAEIRKGSPFIATLSQCFELYTHNTMEVINQVQILGIGPGDPGSIIPRSRTIYSEGVVTTPENVPAPGTKIHELFAASYYNPNDKEAWYFWGEPYVIK